MRFVLQLLLVTAVAATGTHDPADIELRDIATGKVIQSVRAYTENLPEWAKPYAEWVGCRTNGDSIYDRL